MAETDTETLPNGTAALSEEDERLKQRPADIDADVREMERRKRVEALMSSKLFREELERVLDQQLHDGNDAPLLQRIREMVGGRLHTGSLRGPSCVLPINDIRGIEGVGYEKGEKILRCKLAAVYRLVDLFGWTQTGISGQITARLNTAVEQVLTTPRGLLPHEVTASSLVKVDMQGQVQDQGTTNFPVNVEGFSLHASVHAARPDVRCVLHIRSPSALAVSSMKRGLLPLCNEAALLGDIAYHRVPYGNLDNEERDKLVRALGPHAKVLMLSSGGALCCGGTLEEAFYQARNLTAACDVQLRVASLPLDELSLIDEETRKQMYETSRKPPSDAVKWRVGGEEFEALMRMLDNAGFRTGYIYRHPLIKNDVPKPKNDVEVPPAVSSLGYLLEEEELYRQGIWKKGHGTKGERTRWLNSPNVYQKVEVLETGTNDPKKITKWVDANNEEWVQDGSPAHNSTPVKIDTLQFVPKNTNPKEFKALQQQIKDNRRADKISAGPQSHILEGVTWDEASKLVGEDAANTHTGDHVVLMGAASKGIIQRGYQHNATMYSAPYARNPFDHVTDREIDEYRRIVERKQRSDYDTDLSESEAISAAQITSPASAPSETEEESRDEHRVLRIETKQVPVRSQPEVVLSDVDTTDFLNAERSHADRTKDAILAQNQRDPNLLSDDEVFLDSTASSTATSRIMSPVQPVMIREQQTAIQHSVVRGTKLTPGYPTNEALSTSKRNLHDYSRNANFENVIKKFDSPENNTNDTKKPHPKCKVSLNSRLDIKCDALELGQGNFSSRSSLYSIPSIEWDGRCKSENAFRTQSLPRQRGKIANTDLYRTRSHSGFVNSHIKDPEPNHFHLPKCRTCGSTNSSYVWELTKEEKKRAPTSMYFSVDNIHQKCAEEDGYLKKVRETFVPVFRVPKVESEFVESQEFNEDNYLGDIGSDFSSDNQTVIEKSVKVDESDNTITDETVKACGEENQQLDNSKDQFFEIDLYRAEPIAVMNIEDNAVVNTTVSSEGEYHSFTEEMDFDGLVYESPIKELVIKDIRDYSVPIDFYCEDFAKKDGSPVKSPMRKREGNLGNVLEPILEESKSSYGDDSSNISGSIGKVEVCKELDDCNGSDDAKTAELIEPATTDKIDVEIDANDVKTTTREMSEAQDVDICTKLLNVPSKVVINNIVQDLLKTVVTAVQLKSEILMSNHEKVTRDVLEKEFVRQDAYFVAEEDSDITVNEVASVSINMVETAVDIYPGIDVEETVSLDQEEILDSVYENVFKILSTDAICSDTVTSDLSEKISMYSIASSTIEFKSFDSTVEFEKYEIITDILANIVNKIDFENLNNDYLVNLPKRRYVGNYFDLEPVVETNVDNKSYTCSGNSMKSVTTTDTDSDSYCDNFSIVQIIEDIEQNVFLNETILTETSESDSQSYGVVESITYHILQKVYFLLAEKAKVNRQNRARKVVTVVDIEDILYTALPLWSDLNDSTEIKLTPFDLEEELQNDVKNAALRVVQDIEVCLNHDVTEETYNASEHKVNMVQILDSEQLGATFDMTRAEMIAVNATNVRLQNYMDLDTTELTDEHFKPDYDHVTSSMIFDDLNARYFEPRMILADLSQTKNSTTTLKAEIIKPEISSVDIKLHISETNITAVPGTYVDIVDKLPSDQEEAISEPNIFNIKPDLSGTDLKVVTYETYTDLEAVIADLEMPLTELKATASKEICATDSAGFEMYIPDPKAATRVSTLIGDLSSVTTESNITVELKSLVQPETYTRLKLANMDTIVDTNMKSGIFELEVDLTPIASTGSETSSAIPEITKTDTNAKSVVLEISTTELDTSANLKPAAEDVKTENLKLASEELESSDTETESAIKAKDTHQEVVTADPEIPITDLKPATAGINGTIRDNATVISVPTTEIVKSFSMNINATSHDVSEEYNLDQYKTNTIPQNNSAAINTSSGISVPSTDDNANHLYVNVPTDIITEPITSIHETTAKEVNDDTKDFYIEINDITEVNTASTIPSINTENLITAKNINGDFIDPSTDAKYQIAELSLTITVPNTSILESDVTKEKNFVAASKKALVEFQTSTIPKVASITAIDNKTFIIDRLSAFNTKIENTSIEDEIIDDKEKNYDIQHYIDEIFDVARANDSTKNDATHLDSHYDSYETATEIIYDLLEKSSLLDCNRSCQHCKAKSTTDIEKNLDKTFVLSKDNEDMNTAFLSDDANEEHYRSSSPNRGRSVFELCSESPIRHPSDTFIGEDLSVLYEKDDTILGSPFVKVAPVISMSQNEHSGGIKYWLSFDESLTESQDKETKPIKRSVNKIPSFVAVDFSHRENENDHLWDVVEKEKHRRSSVLLEDFNQSSDTKSDYASPCASTDYKTCDSDMLGSKSSEKKLLYDSRIDLHKKVTTRQYNSWPPFEDTLFYRIISKFRMTESFDPIDFENFQITDNSL